ncbi:hypothetical protein [Novibacillus thermophilus]|jgi:hypothetical protein|uniref:hypothetical protein n=1 Tax=Novibacillus thermophilus TaxID=1471761 RepID=UPI001473B89D|nr:hypothetical protein [Novibacillus thermophilus]
MYYVIREENVPRATVMHEDDYFKFFNPLRRDHRIEYSGSQNNCYRYFYGKYPRIQ